MMNINCTLKCCFEEDGKCGLTHVTSLSSTPHPSCAYYTPRNQFHAITTKKRNP